NTFQAMAIDLETRKPVFNNVFAGLSGPAIYPIALRMVYQVCGAVRVPVVGLGGIATAQDALAFLMAGASAVQVGTASFANPRACADITDGIAAWMQQHGVNDLAEIRGCARV
ncbi:MAG: nitronate monooxygenase, partial [Ruthenibacterium sp.]